MDGQTGLLMVVVSGMMALSALGNDVIVVSIQWVCVCLIMLAGLLSDDE